MPRKPCAPALVNSSRSTMPASSHSSWWGTSSLAMNARTESRNRSCSSSNRVRCIGCDGNAMAPRRRCPPGCRRGRDDRALRVGWRPGAGGSGGEQPHPQRGLGGVAARRATGARRGPGRHGPLQRAAGADGEAVGARRRRHRRRLRVRLLAGGGAREAARSARSSTPRTAGRGSAGRWAPTSSRWPAPRVAPGSPSRSLRAAPPRSPVRDADGFDPGLVMELNRTDVRAIDAALLERWRSAGEAAAELLAGRLRRALPHRRAGPRLHRRPRR